MGGLQTCNLKTRVRLSLVPLRGCSSIGRALALHARGRGFDSLQLHFVMNRSDAGKLGWERSQAAKKIYYDTCRAKYESAPNTCGNCARVFTYEERHKKYCNHSCAAISANKRSPKRKPTHECSVCGTLITRGYLRCNSCAKIPRVLSIYKTDRSRKISLINSRGHRCESCNNSEWLGRPITLELDHIDGDHENNSEYNLKLLCPNCHSQTSTYKGKNKGNGRVWRREMYATYKQCLSDRENRHLSCKEDYVSLNLTSGSIPIYGSLYDFLANLV